MPYKILFIDDDEFIRKIYTDRLSASGFELDISASGEDGIRKIEANRYDLICTDNALPDKSGIDVIAFARDKRPETPIVMFSASGQDALMKEVLDAGAVEYIVKDHVVPTQLAGKLTAIIESPRA